MTPGRGCPLHYRYAPADLARGDAPEASCLPVLMDFATRDGRGVVANNGAAGMPNFAGTQFGVITRIDEACRLTVSRAFAPRPIAA